MIPTVIGAKPPRYSRIWRRLAEKPLVSKSRYTVCDTACDGFITSAVPQNYPVDQYHFRTPSPGGQQMHSSTLLPASFSCFTLAARALSSRLHSELQAVFRPSRRDCAHPLRAEREQLTGAYVGVFVTHTSKGKKTWVSSQSYLRQLRPSALRPAVIPWPNAPSLAERSAQVQVPSPAAASSAAQPSGRQATYLPANWKASTADRLTRTESRQTTHHERRRALPHGGVLHFNSNSSEAQCSQSF